MFFGKEGVTYKYKPGGLSFALANWTAKAIDSLVAPRPISPLIGRPSNLSLYKKKDGLVNRNME